MTLIFNAGTVEATNGSTAITFTGAGLLPMKAQHGDEIAIDGSYRGYIDTVDFDAQTATVLPPFDGSTSAGKPYAIRRATPLSVTASEAMERTFKLLNDMSVYDSEGVGLLYSFNTTTAVANPGIQKVAINNVILSNVTKVLVSTTDGKGKNVDALVNLLDANTIIIIRSVETAAFLAVRVTTPTTTASGFADINVEYITHDGYFENNEPLVFGYIFAGVSAALGPKFLFNTAVTASDPGTGKIKFNSATLGSITTLYISETDNSGISAISLINNMTEAVNVNGRSYIQIAADGIGSESMTFRVMGAATDAGTYRTVPVTYISGTLPPNNRPIGISVAMAGNDGYAPGAYMEFSNATTASDPGTGKIKFNNATIGSVTALYVDNTDLLGVSIATYLDTFDDRINQVARGYIILQSTAGNDEVIFRVTGVVTDSTGYRTISVAHLSGTLPANLSRWKLNFVMSGADGRSSGLKMTWSSSTTDADPGVGNIAANHATFAGTTQLFIDDSDPLGGSITAFVDSWDDVVNATARGLLTLQADRGSNGVMTFRVTGPVVNGTGYRKVPVAPVNVYGGGFSNGQELALTFIPSSADGVTADESVTAAKIAAADIVAIRAKLEAVGANVVNAFTADQVISKANPALVLQKASSGQTAAIYGRVGALPRWVAELGGPAAESTGNLGSNFSLSRYTDAGLFLGTPFSISRATGVSSFTAMPEVAGNPIVETITNANGTAVRYADGTQIAWKTVSFVTGATTAQGALFAALGVSGGSWAAAFVSGVSVACSGTDSGGKGWPGCEVYATNTAAGTWRLYNYVSQGTAGFVYLIATGRWF